MPATARTRPPPAALCHTAARRQGTTRGRPQAPSAHDLEQRIGETADPRHTRNQSDGEHRFWPDAVEEKREFEHDASVCPRFISREHRVRSVGSTLMANTFCSFAHFWGARRAATLSPRKASRGNGFAGPTGANLWESR